jgi:hypothetical protein
MLLARGDVGVCDYIGISKLCCLVCYAFITEFGKAHHIKFRTSGTHNNLYEWSGLPADFENITAAGGGFDGAGGAALSIEQALRGFDGMRLWHIFSETRRRVAMAFQD